MNADTLDPRPEPSDRRTWLLAVGTTGAVALGATAVPFVSSLAPSERAKALGAAVEVNIADIPPGGMKTVEWRGKPVWILRRTPQMLQALAAHDGQLADPASRKDDLLHALRGPGRSIRPEIFVAVGICTHLGCSPTAVPAGSDNPGVGADWTGGFLCPCHGSTFDLAGRVYRNKPAPTNLEVPPHRYISDARLLIGESDAG